jgi:hypothetical protein
MQNEAGIPRIGFLSVFYYDNPGFRDGPCSWMEYDHEYVYPVINDSIYYGKNGKVRLEDYFTEINYTGVETSTSSKIFSTVETMPNPFNPATKLIFTILKESPVNLSVYNTQGKLVNVLVNETKPPGKYSILWNALNQPSGIYVFKLQAGDIIATRKGLLIK